MIIFLCDRPYGIWARIDTVFPINVTAYTRKSDGAHNRARSSCTCNSVTVLGVCGCEKSRYGDQCCWWLRWPLKREKIACKIESERRTKRCRVHEILRRSENYSYLRKWFFTLYLYQAHVIDYVCHSYEIKRYLLNGYTGALAPTHRKWTLDYNRETWTSINPMLYRRFSSDARKVAFRWTKV